MRKPQTPEKKAECALIGKRIKEVRKEAGLSLGNVADRLNKEFAANTNKGMLSKYENGIHEPSASMVYCMGLIMGVSSDYLMGKTDEKYPPRAVQGSETSAVVLNVYKSMKDFGDGEIDETVHELIPKEWLVGGKEFFGYKVGAGRYAPRYYSGDVIIFEKKVKVARDQVAIVSVGDEEAFLCTINKKREGKIIIPLDPAYDSKFYSTEELASIPVKIIGAAVQVRRSEI